MAERKRKPLDEAAIRRDECAGCDCAALRAELADVTADRDRWVVRNSVLESRLVRIRAATEGRDA